MWPFRTPTQPDAPSWKTPLIDAPLLAVDFETTGLDPDQDRIVSMGWVPVNGFEIDLSGAGYVVVAGGAVGDSATLHGLMDDEVAAGVQPEKAYAMLRDALAGRMMLVHYERIETTFLAQLHKQVEGTAIQFPAVDTMAIERRHMERMGTYPRGEDLRLPRVRERYELPWYSPHNAAGDALACAELYLAQVIPSKATTLGDLRY